MKLSILSITYNHSKYISKAIESFLMQKTDFDIEVIIADDASTDNNQEIIREYADKYPDIIKPILREKNIGMNANFMDAFSKCQGKYIALCEGDDYWICPLKLQKQVDFLEENPEYGLVYSDIYMIDKDNKAIVETTHFKIQKNRYKSGHIFFDLLQGNFINTLTVCVRTDLMHELVGRIESENLNFVYDYWFWLNISRKTKIKFINEKLADYRVHDMGISRRLGYLRKLTPLVYYDVISSLLKRKKQFTKREKDILFNLFYTLFRNKQLTEDNKKWVKRNMIKYRPSINYFIYRIKRKMLKWR